MSPLVARSSGEPSGGTFITNLTQGVHCSHSRRTLLSLRVYTALTQGVHCSHSRRTLLSLRVYTALTQGVHCSHSGRTLHSLRAYTALTQGVHCSHSGRTLLSPLQVVPMAEERRDPEGRPAQGGQELRKQGADPQCMHGLTTLSTVSTHV